MSDALIEVLAADDSGYSDHGQLCPCARGTSKEKPKSSRSILECNGGPWAKHDAACPVCQERKAVLDLAMGIFQPCWRCQRSGWITSRRRVWLRLHRNPRVVPVAVDPTTPKDAAK